MRHIEHTKKIYVATVMVVQSVTLLKLLENEHD